VHLRFLTSTPQNIQHGSGTFVGIRTLAQALRRLGVTVDLIAPKVHLPVYTAERLLFNETLRFRRREHCDAVVGFDMDGYTIAGRHGFPHIASLKGVIADELRNESGLTRATMLVQAACEAVHVSRADLVIATSRYSAERLERFYGTPKAHVVVPELIDLAGWRDLLARSSGPSDKFTVLCVCRLYRRKRVELLLGAAARLRDRIPELEVRIAGNGPEAAKLRGVWHEKRLENTVLWLGDVSLSQLASEYKRADVFCLPSVQEGFGIVFLEAMAAGKPIVAARAAAIPEVVRHGILVEPESDGAVAQAIETLYRDPALRRSLAEAGSEFVEQFDAPRVARQFLSDSARR
jgi:glycosyltransferase involved in cell wall biosynthesis